MKIIVPELDLAPRKLYLSSPGNFWTGLGMLVRAIALAAGYGTRLKPLTDSIPKPLLPFCGRPILDLALERLFKAGAKTAAVNAHHLADKIEGHLEASSFRDRTTLYVEKTLLGTGGPLVNAKDELSDCDCILLHNGDIVCDFDLGTLVEAHLSAGSLATLCLIEGPENKVLASNGRILDILGKLGAARTPESRLFTYSGVAAFSPRILDFLPNEPQFCSIIDAILKALAKTPGAAAAYIPENPFWSDIGTFEQYFKAHEKALLHGVMKKAGPDSPFVFGQDCRVSPEASLSGFVAASSHCEISRRASVSNCILLEGASVAEGESRRNEIIGPSTSFHRETPTLLSLKALACVPKPWSASSLPEQGSDRKFLRVRGADSMTRILMLSSEKDLDFERYVQIGSFLHSNGLRTPEIYSYDMGEFAVLMEDLGDGTLFNLMRENPAPERVESLYSAVVDALADFQIRGTAALKSAQNFHLRLFDYEYLRWETSYFKENFLELLCGLAPSPGRENSLAEEFHALASQTRALPQTLMHRDFQSQNILVKDGAPRFVDFQGARLGPFTYDLASLLKDPYVSISREMRRALAKRHFERLSEGDASFSRMGFESFNACLLLSSLQRNMQALGAYGFLSMKKRKPKYLDFVRPCLSLLLEGIEELLAMDAPPFRPETLAELCNQAREELNSTLESAKAIASATNA